MNRTLAKQIRVAIMANRPRVERVRFKQDEIHAFGVMPNSNARGWWFVAYVFDVETKGIDILA